MFSVGVHVIFPLFNRTYYLYKEKKVLLHIPKILHIRLLNRGILNKVCISLEMYTEYAFMHCGWVAIASLM
jgi:hypothetical protein